MSEFKNDPQGIKQGLAALICTAGAVVLLLISSTGASIDCVQNACTLKRQELGHASSERFSWTDVTAVRTRAVSYARTGTGGRQGVASTNLVLELGPARTVEVFASGVAWVFGSLDYPALDQARTRGWGKRLHGVSLGGAALAGSSVLALCGMLFVLFSIITPIRMDMPAAELSAARKTNLFRLTALLFVGSAFWCAVVAMLVYWLTSA